MLSYSDLLPAVVCSARSVLAPGARRAGCPADPLAALDPFAGARLRG